MSQITPGTGTGTTGNAVERLITELGGVRPFASAIGLSPSTVQGWKERGKVPKNRQTQVFERLAAHGVATALLVSALPHATPPASATAGAATAPRTGRTGELTSPQTSGKASRQTNRHRSPGRSPGVSPAASYGAEKLRARRRIVTGVAVLVLLAAILITILDIFLALPLGYEIPNPAERQVAQVITQAPEHTARPALAPLAVQPSAAERARFAEAVQLEAVESRLKLLEDHVTSLTAATRTLRRGEETLLVRIAEAEALARRRPDAAAGAVLALSQLRATVDSGAPYREALDVATRLAPDQAATLTRALSENALLGIPSYNQLARLLEETTLKVRGSANGKGGWRGWFGRILGVRLSSGTDTQDPLAALTRAQTALATGDLASAVLAAENATGVGAIHTEPWLRAARARLTATAALAEAQTAALQTLAQSVGEHQSETQ